MWRLRRNLECLTAEHDAKRRLSMAVNTPELTRALEELIEALDRRVAHIERAGEDVIARDAAALRAKAVNRLAELTGEHNAKRRPT
jgi:hypothetical protein